MSYDTLASEESIQKVVGGLTGRNVTVHLVDTKEEALAKVKSLIPEGVSVNTGASVTLEQIGFVDLLKSGAHPWKNLKEAVIAEKDPLKQALLRKQSVLSDYFLGSVHAVTESGEVMVASNTGSQFPSYAFTSENVIWVVGAQKIVHDMENGFKRIHEYVVPLENTHMQQLYGKDTNLSKMFLFFKETSPTRKMKLVLVKKEVLGF